MDTNNHVKLVRIIQNNLYTFRYAFHLAPVYYTFYIIINSVIRALDSVVIVLLYKALMDGIRLHKSYGDILTYIFLYGVLLSTIVYVGTSILERVNEIKSTEISGKIQRNIIKKASDIDIVYYDNSKFYDNFVRVATQGDEQIVAAISIIINLIARIASLTSLVSLIVTIDPVMAIFPIIACIICVSLQLWVSRLNYELSLKIDPIRHRKEYFTRIFYRAEYAKELRLTKIKEPLFDMFQETIGQEIAYTKKYGKKACLISALERGIGKISFVYYFPPVYLIYNAMITRKIGIGQLAAMNEANVHTYSELDSLTYQFIDLQKIGLFTEKFRNFMEMPNRVEHAEGDQLCFGEPKLLQVKNLSFQYEEDGRKILSDINMTIRPKEKIAIVGFNGAGKTTFTKLLLRFYDPTDGEILYDGRNIKEYGTDDYRKQFGVVFQDFQIYAGTVGQNISMDYLTEDMRESAEEAFHKINLHSREEDDGFNIDTELTREFETDGTVLSGGENQKLAFARLLVKKYNIAILDEPSSALDPIAEYQLNQTIKEMAEESTVIFIAHRLSSTRMADKVYLFENGTIIEQGTHDELMKMNGKYAEMFQKQAYYYQNQKEEG